MDRLKFHECLAICIMLHCAIMLCGKWLFGISYPSVIISVPCGYAVSLAVFPQCRAATRRMFSS